MKPVAGFYSIAGANYTAEEIQNIYSDATRKVEVKHATGPCNTQNETRKDEKPPNETRKPEMQHAPQAIETRKTNKARLGSENGKHIGTFIIDGIEYQSAHDAAKALNLAPSTIIRRCRKKIEGYEMMEI